MNIAWVARRLALVVPTLLAATVVVFLMIDRRNNGEDRGAGAHQRR